MIKYKTLKITAENSPQIAKLVLDTFSVFNHQEGDKESVANYLAQFDSKKVDRVYLSEQFNRLNINLGAFTNDKLVGVIRGKKNRIINLFVDKKFHNLGIGRKLVEKFEEISKQEDADVIKIRASLYATAFYQKIGYKKTTGIRMFHGLKTQPMIKKIK